MSAAEKAAFLEKLREFHKEHGTDFKIPVLAHMQLDLYVVYHEVIARGGMDEVVAKRQWQEIKDILGLPKSCTNAAFALRKSYTKILLPFEQKSMHGIEPTFTPFVSGSSLKGGAPPRDRTPPPPPISKRKAKKMEEESKKQKTEQASIAANVAAQTGLFYSTSTSASVTFSILPPVIRGAEKRSRSGRSDVVFGSKDAGQLPAPSGSEDSEASTMDGDVGDAQQADSYAPSLSRKERRERQREHKEKEKSRAPRDTALLEAAAKRRNALPFKNRGYTVGGKNARGHWRGMKQILAKEAEETAAYSVGTDTYMNLSAPPSLRPQKRYCDLTGLDAPYIDPATRMRYHGAEQFKVARQLPESVVGEYLAMRGGNAGIIR